jgi:hypothetical protein
MDCEPFVIRMNLQRYRAQLQYEPDFQVREMLHRLIAELKQKAPSVEVPPIP